MRARSDKERPEKETEMARKLFPYDRFSYATQEAGSSEERQLEMVRAVAKEFKAEICTDYELSDHGVSGFRGRNIKKKLGLFIRLCKEGVIRKGDILCFERVSRLSRMDWLKQATLWEEILSYGVEIVTCEPRFHLTRANIGRIAQGCPLAVLMMLANEESQQKSDWVKYAVRSAHKAAREQGTPHGKRCPGWLRPLGHPHPLNPKRRITTGWEIIEERRRIVRQLHEWAWADHGAPTITRMAIEAGLPYWGKDGKWSQSAVEYLLTNQALIGLVVPDIKNYKCEETIPEVYHNYPPILTPEEFHRTKLALRSRRKSGGRPWQHGFNLFKGILRTLDGRTLHQATYLDSDGSKKAYLAPKPQSLRVPYQPAEDNFLATLAKLRPEDIDGTLRPDEWSQRTLAWQSEQAKVRMELDDMAGQLRELPRERRPKMIVSHVADLEERLEWLQNELDKAKLYGSTSARVETLSDTQSILTYLAGITEASERLAALERVRARLPVLLESLTVAASGQRGKSRWLHWRVSYKGGHTFYYSFAVGRPDLPSPAFCRKW